jgi:hypothetical protein
MLSQSRGIYILSASVISSLLLIFNNLWLTKINNKFQLERENQQRNWQEERERQKWYREKTYDSYRTSIQVLTKIIQVRYEIEHDNDKFYQNSVLPNLYFEFTSEFFIIIGGHPNKDTEEFKEKINEIVEYMKEDTVLARLMMTEIMQEDPRIKDVNKGYLNSKHSST